MKVLVDRNMKLRQPSPSKLEGYSNQSARCLAAQNNLCGNGTMSVSGVRKVARRFKKTNTEQTGELYFCPTTLCILNKQQIL